MVRLNKVTKGDGFEFKKTKKLDVMAGETLDNVGRALKVDDPALIEFDRQDGRQPVTWTSSYGLQAGKKYLIVTSGGIHDWQINCRLIA